MRDGKRISGVWDLAARAAPPECESLAGHGSPAAWNPATGRLAIVEDGCLCLSVVDGWARIPLDPVFRVSSLAFSPDGLRIAMAFSRESNASPRWGLSVRPLAQLLADRFGELSSDPAPCSAAMPGEVESVSVREKGPNAFFRVAARLSSRVIVFRATDAGALEEETSAELPIYMGGGDTAWSWSPDGRRLAWISQSAVWLSQLVQEGEAPKSRLALHLSDEPAVLVFAPDGVHLAVGSSRGEIVVWGCTHGLFVPGGEPRAAGGLAPQLTASGRVARQRRGHDLGFANDSPPSKPR
jgi:hypothetical protein